MSTVDDNKINTSRCCMPSEARHRSRRISKPTTELYLLGVEEELGDMLGQLGDIEKIARDDLFGG